MPTLNLPQILPKSTHLCKSLGRQRISSVEMHTNGQWLAYCCRQARTMVKSSDEGCVQLGVSDEVRYLEDRLSAIKETLADAANSGRKDDDGRDRLRKLKDVMYEAADILDVCAIEGDKRIARSRTNPMAFCLPTPAVQIRRQVKALNQRMDAILKVEKKFSFPRLRSLEDQKVDTSTVRRRAEPQSISIIGMEQDRSKLVQMLIEEDGISGMTGDDILAVAIVGLGGTGKTTLAQMVFNDDMILSQFDMKIWLCISDSVSPVNLLQETIIAVRGHHGGTQDRAVLEHILSSQVRGKKVFLVMDDMWGAKAWVEILKIPLMSSVRGSRVLITTRLEEVAQLVTDARILHVGKLGSEEAWCLLKSQMVTSERDKVEVESLKELGMKIVEKCGGNPLAIKTFGHLLNRNISKDAWEKFLKGLTPAMNVHENMDEILYRGYQSIPYDLKQCFLYCSLVPEDDVISRDKVVQMCIAEEYIQTNGTSKLPEVLGVEYFIELVWRSFLQYVDDKGHYKMHDLVRTFAQNLVRGEALLVQEGQTIPSHPLPEIRRLSLSTTEEVEWSALQKLHSLRTLIIVGSINFKSSTGSTLSTLSGLRILHINNANVNMLLNSLHHLKHLRYLDLSYTDVFALPNDIGKMKFLQYIGLQGCQNLVQLPTSIVELLKLRYLNISDTKIKSIPEEGFGGLKNLVSLWGFPCQVGLNILVDWCSLVELERMSLLKYLTLEGLEYCISGSMANRANLCDKTNLTYLRLSCTSRLSVSGEVQNQQIEDVFDNLCPPPCLEELTIMGYFGARLPRWLISSNLEKLRVLMLENLALCKQLPSILWQLPCLKYLCIKHALNVKRIGHEFLLPSSIAGSREQEPIMPESATEDAATTTRWGSIDNRPCHPSAGSGGSFEEEEEITTESTIDDAPTTTRGRSSVISFPKLNKLVLYGMMRWTEWDWEEQVEAMPVLENLHISRCILKHLPPGLVCQAKALRVLVVENAKNLSSIEGFCSVVELRVSSNFNLERIGNLPRMQKLTVSKCPKLNLLQGVPDVECIELSDHEMETLPEFFRDCPAGLGQLQISCTSELLTLISKREDSPEWEKIKDIKKVRAYANGDDDEVNKWYVFYTRRPFSFVTNITS